MQLDNFCLYIQYLVLDIPGYQPISTPKPFQTGDPHDYFAHLHFWPLRVRPWCSSPSPCFKSGIEHWRHGLLVFHSIKLVLFKGPSPKGGWLTIEHISASTQDKRIQTSQWHANRKSESEATDRNEDGSVGLFEPGDCQSCFHSCFQSMWLVRFPFLHDFVYQLECLWKKEPALKVIQMELSQHVWSSAWWIVVFCLVNLGISKYCTRKISPIPSKETIKSVI